MIKTLNACRKYFSAEPVFGFFRYLVSHWPLILLLVAAVVVSLLNSFQHQARKEAIHYIL